MKTFYLFDTNDLNTGDLGIMVATLEGIRKSIPNSRVFIESQHPKVLSKSNLVEGYDIFPKIFDIQNFDKSTRDKIIALILGIYDCSSFLIWALLLRIGVPISLFIIRPSRRAQAKTMQNVDVFLGSGGGYLNTIHGSYGFRIYMYSLVLILRKKVVLFAQSVGPFDTKLSLLLLPFFLNKLTLIILREKESLKYLNELKVKSKIAVTSDIAFLLDIDSTNPITISNYSKKIISLIVKEPKSLEKRKDYIRIIRSVLGFLLENSYSLVLVSQTPHDDKICNEISKNLNVRIELFGENPKKIKYLYSNCNFIITSRMHAAIFSAGSNIPFITMAYERKFKGLFDQLSYDKNLFLEEDTLDEDHLIKAIKYLIENYDEIRTNLTTSVSLAKTDSQKSIDLLKAI